MIISDDIGSFPVSGKKEITEAYLKICDNKASEEERNLFTRSIRNAMILKIKSGIKAVTYPQLDMMAVLGLIERHSEEYIIDENFAFIPEISAIKNSDVGKFYYEHNNEKLKLRVCITGPLELYVRKFGFAVEEDLLLNLSESVSRFLKNSVINEKYIETSVVCIDEPGLGYSDLTVSDETLISAWNKATEGIKCDTQIHLHSSLVIDKIYDSDIKIIGIESAEDKKNLDFDKKEIEQADKFLRIGISRTNIYGIASEHEDLWKNKKFSEMINASETVKVITERLKYAYSIFGDRIKYAGPDCGLGSWPESESAFILLKNTSEAIEDFNKFKD